MKTPQAFTQAGCMPEPSESRATTIGSGMAAPVSDATSSGAVHFNELFDTADIQRIQDEFAIAAGVASIITHPDGRPITKPSRFTRLCREIIRQTDQGCANCIKSDAALGGPSPDGAIVQSCFNCGLWDAGTRITVGGHHIANWLIGQVRDEGQTEDAMLAYAREIGVDEEVFIQAFREVPSMSIEKFKQIAQLLHTLANQLSTSAFMNVQQARLIGEGNRAEERLRASEERFRSLYDNSTIGLYRTTPAGEIILSNPVAVRMLGYDSFEELTKRNLGEQGFEPSYDRREFCERIERDGQIIGLESIWLRRDGTKIFVRESAKVVRDDQGKVLYYDGTVEDITERTRAEEALRESEEHYRYMFENNPQPMWIYDLETLFFVQVNNAAVKHYGYSKEEFLSMTLKDIRPAEDLEKLMLDIEKTDSNLNSAGEWTHVKKNGEKIYVEIISHTVTFNDRAARHVLVNDITARKQAEEALRRSLSLVQATLESTGDGILVVDLNRQLTGYNHQFVTMWNVPPEVLETRDNAQLLAYVVTMLKDPEEFLKKVDFLFRNPEIESFDIIEFSDGRIFERYSQPQRIDGKPIGRVWNFRDMTERKSLERQLIQAQKLEGIGTLAGGIAHDFNNLLAMILGSAELLRFHMPAQPQLQKYVNGIIEASLRGTSISRQLLTFSRPNVTELKPISLSHTICEAKEMLAHFFPKSISIRTPMDVDNGIIMGDPGQIHQAILNLAINAGDAMKDGGTLTISEFMVDAETIHQKFGHHGSICYIAISVSDTGMGIEAAVLEKIFDPFFTTKEKGKGTGLGLSNVHGIVKNHKGFIDVESQLGQGTTFTMYFPSVSAPRKEDRSEHDTAVVSHTGTILLVDDEVNIREMLSEHLMQSGFRVLTATNGREALDVFKKNRADISMVITDLGMPQMGGEELLRRLLTLDPAVSVIASSGYLEGTTKSDLKAIGFQEILTKPYKLAEITSVIQSVLTAQNKK